MEKKIVKAYAILNIKDLSIGDAEAVSAKNFRYGRKKAKEFLAGLLDNR